MRALTNLVLTGVIAVGAHAATTYDAAQDFSSVNNPSGVWSYGYLLSTNSAFRLYPTNVNGSWALWAKDPFLAPPNNWYTEGLFALSSNPESIQFYRRSPIPYTYNELCVLRFTAPTAGQYSLDFVFAVEANPGVAGVDMEISLKVNGETLASQYLFSGGGFPYSGAWSLPTGATIDFVIDGKSVTLMGSERGFLTATVRLDTQAVPPAVLFSPPGGLFTNSLSLRLVNNLTNGVIRYTLDGSNPTSSSPAYTNGIAITVATEVRAAVFEGNTPISQVYTSGYARVYAIDDGIPASWREQYFGAGYLTDPRVAADADPDGDLATNREEYLADTNPLDNTSGFKATVQAIPLIRFGSETNRVYRILRSDDLSTNRTVVATLTATNSLTSYVDTSVYTNRGFYVIELLP